jgi:hypothetical protein
MGRKTAGIEFQEANLVGLETARTMRSVGGSFMILRWHTLPILCLLLAGGMPNGACSSRRESAAQSSDRGAAPSDVSNDVPPLRPDSGGPPGVVDLKRVTNLDRFPGLTDEHRRRLARDGFFIVASTAKAPFQLYERNERLGLPSLVLPQLAVDVLRGVFSAVDRDIENNFAAPPLHRALLDLVRDGLELRKFSLGDGRDELAALDRVIATFAVAAHLLAAEGARPADLPLTADDAGEEDEAHPLAGRVPVIVPLDEPPWSGLPPTVEGLFQEAISAIRAADGIHVTAALGCEADFGVFRVAEQAEPGRSRALLRTLLWLDLAAPASAGDLADNLTAPLLLRLFAGLALRSGREGDPWMQVAMRLETAGRDWHGTAEYPVLGALLDALGASPTLPPSAGASIRMVLAVPELPPRGTLGLLPGRLADDGCGGCDDAALWLGPGAVGSAVGRRLVEGLRSDPVAAPWLPDGTGGVADAAARWHGYLRSLDGLLALQLARPTPVPRGLDAPDCLPAGSSVVRGAVVPSSATYRELGGLIDDRAVMLQSLGILPQREIEDPDGAVEEAAYRIQELLGSADRFSHALASIGDTELRGEAWTEEQIATVSRIGSWAESILADAAQADAVDPGDPSWVELHDDGTISGVGGVDVIYAVVATPDGPALARGATWSFYDGLRWPGDAEPDDAAWDAWLSSPVSARTGVATDVTAPVLPPPPLVGEGNRSCLGADSGGDLAL